MTSDSPLIERLATLRLLLRPTPIVRLDEGPNLLFCKLEHLNVVGSIKDRPAFWMLKQAAERGEVNYGSMIVESSSGNLACALATYCRYLGLEFTAVIDPNICSVYEKHLRAVGASIYKVEDADNAGGYLKTRLKAVQEILARTSNAYWTNQYGNPDASEAHYIMTGNEIVVDLPDVDYVFLGVSSAGTIAGVSRRLKEHNPRTKIIAVDSHGSTIFGGSPASRKIPGIGSSTTPQLLDRALIDEVLLIHERDAIIACDDLLTNHGIFSGGSTGSVYSAIKQYFDGYRGRPQKILFLSCDRGGAYADTIYNAEWIKTHFSLAFSARKGTGTHRG